ncbi:MAG: tetratricopeptide repeat protein, partial [Gammaproteobacteria bacterium]
HRNLYLTNALRGLLCLPALLLVACSGTTVKEDTADTATEQTAEPQLIRVEPVRPKIELTDELLSSILEAEFAGQRGRIDVSLKNYLELARSTRDHKVVERATRIAVFARDTEAAAEMANLWVELDPRNPDPHQILAVMSLRNNDVETSLVHLESILDYTYGELDQKLLMIANMLGRETDSKLIMEVMERIIAKRGDSPEALFAFSRVAAMLGEYDRALDLLEQTIRHMPDDDAVAMSYIAVLQRVGRTDEAVTWLERTLARKKGEDFNLRLAYARLLTEINRHDESRRQFEILVKQEPDNTDVLFALSLLYLQLARLDDAETYLLRLSDRNERSNEVNYYLGRIAEDRGDFNKAAIWYQGVQAGQNYFDSQLRLALSLARQERFEEARDHLNTISTRNEAERAMLVQAEAELLVEQGRLAEAMEIYDEALVNNYNSDLLYSRAMLAEKMDRLDVLEADLNYILEREPDNSHALNALGYTLADRTDRYEEAEALIDRALELRPDDHYILDSKGWVLYRMGKLDEAIKYLRKAHELVPDTEIAAHLGEVLWVKGDRKEAMNIWDTALKAAPDNTLLQDVIQRFNP